MREDDLVPAETGRHVAQGHASARGEPSAEDAGTALDHEQLARTLGELSRRLQGQADTDSVLVDIIAAAVELIPGADAGSISVVARGERQVTSFHPTDDLPRQIDVIQSEVGQGPCLDAAFYQQTVRVPDMREEQRWPQFARRADELGAGGMLAFQLYVTGDNLGALNLVSRQRNAFTDESENVGLIFASHAAVAFADARKVQQLTIALDSRDIIGQAKGMLMERYRISAVDAFRVLTRVSRDNNRKLIDLATELASTRNLPGLNSREGSRADPV